MKKISIIIPNWNGRYLLPRFFPEVVDTSDGAEIIFVDDHSDDNSIEYIRSNYPQTIILENKGNRGFSTTVNLGVNNAKGEIIVLLNSDIKPEKGYISKLLPYFSDEMVFAVGCLEKSHEINGIMLRGRGIAKWEKGFFIHNRGKINKSDTAWVSGGSGAFSRKIWLELGGMSEIYDPFYWEDIDISYRALKSGYKLYFSRESVVHHFHNIGKIKSIFKLTTIRRISYRNQFMFSWINLTSVSLFVSHIFWTSIRVSQHILRGDIWFLFGFLSALTKINKIMEKRKKMRREAISDEDILRPFINE